LQSRGFELCGAAVDRYGQAELAIAHLLWDVSTDLEVTESRNQALALGLNAGVDEIRALAAAVERSGRTNDEVRRGLDAERLVHRALLDLEVVAVRLSADVSQTLAAVEDFRSRLDTQQRLQLEEVPLPGHQLVRTSLLETGWLQRVDTRARHLQVRCSAAESLVRSLIQNLGGVFEARRAAELPRLERATHRMNLMLGLLAAVLALDTLFDYRVADVPNSVTKALRIGVFATIAAVILVVARGWLAVRRVRKAARRTQRLYEEIVELNLGLNGDSGDVVQVRALDDRLAASFAAIVEELAAAGADDVLGAEQWALETLLAAGRTTSLYTGPFVRLSILTQLRLGLPDFEFDHTLQAGGIYDIERVRRWCALSSTSDHPSAVLDALREAGLEVGSPNWAAALDALDPAGACVAEVSTESQIAPPVQAPADPVVVLP
jgi:hypothetical protein